jgi:hypothetical protein
VHEHTGDGCCTPAEPEATAGEIQAERIIQVTAETFGFTPADITGDRRMAGLVWARHVAMYLCRVRTNLSLPALGRVFGMHHTSVWHGVNRIADRVIAEDPAAKAAVERASRALGLTRTYALCPADDCERLVESWQIDTEYRDVVETAPAWPGGPILEVPGTIAKQEPVRTTARFAPCGHEISWEPGEDGFTMHAIDLPLDTAPIVALHRLLEIRDSSTADAPSGR